MNKARMLFYITLFISCLALLNPVFAQEQITITTYYPSPFGSYNELTVANREAIGDINGDGKVDKDDMAINFYTGDPISGSLMVTDKITVGTRQPWARFEVRSSTIGGGVDNTLRLIATHPLVSKGGPIDGNRSPAFGLAEADGTPVGALGMAGEAGAWSLQSQPGDLVLTTGNKTNKNMLFSTADPADPVTDLSQGRMIIIPNGNVGINTLTPTQKLDVNGKAKVNSVIYTPQAGDPTHAWPAGSEGELAYSQDYDAFYYYNGAWLAQAGGGGSGASYVAWGTTNCAPNWDKAYDGVATFATTWMNQYGGGTIICKQGAAFPPGGMAFPDDRWSTVGSDSSTANIACAVCVK